MGDRLLGEVEKWKPLAERLSRLNEVARYDDGEESEAWTLAHAFADLEESLRRFTDELLPRLVREGLGDDEALEVLYEIGEEFRHVAYHLRDTRFYSYLERGLSPDLLRMVDSRDVDGLVSRLASEVAMDVSEALVLVGSPAVGPLREALKSENRFVAGWAAVTLAELGDEGADERLVGFLRNFDYSTLPDPIYWIWSAAVTTLGERRVVAAVEPLIDALAVNNGEIREEAAGALGEIGKRKAVEPLIALLDVEDIGAIVPECFSIEEALRALGGAKAQRALTEWDERVAAWEREFLGHRTDPKRP